MPLQTMFIVNKAGSLIFYRKLSDAAPQLSQNRYIHLASTLHGSVSGLLLPPRPHRLSPAPTPFLSANVVFSRPPVTFQRKIACAR